MTLTLGVTGGCDVEGMEKAARAAFDDRDRGRWRLGENCVLGVPTDDDHNLFERVASRPRLYKHDSDGRERWRINADHIAAWCPASAIAVLDRLRAAEAARDAAIIRADAAEALLAADVRH